MWILRVNTSYFSSIISIFMLQGQKEHIGISILLSNTIIKVTRGARRVGGRRQ